MLLQVDVCDKLLASADDPQEDVSYYPQFQYTLLDGTGTVDKFDSTPAKDATGEVEVSETDTVVSALHTTVACPTTVLLYEQLTGICSNLRRRSCALAQLKWGNTRIVTSCI